MKHLSNVDPEAALNALSEEPGQVESTEPVSVDDQPDPSALEAKQEDAPTPEETKATAQAIADLSKFQKVTIDGKELSIDDLKKSMLRQDDYTRKTQEVAKERKYYDNLQIDLSAVRQNPSLAADFKRVYPAKFHQYLDLILQKDAAEAEQKGQASQLPPEVMQKLEKYDQMFGTLEQKAQQEQVNAIDAKLQTIEGNLSKKFPYADTVFAYTLAQEAKAKWEQENGQPMPPEILDEKFLEPFFKASHNHQEATFKKWQKEQVTKARSSHKEASDIGRGGGTPGEAPNKLKLKDVAEYFLSNNEP